MDFSDALTLLSDKVSQQWESIQTEEATKNAFIMPFISTVLGYDVFDPREVIPEFVADVGVKKGEKIDYAIAKDGEVQILIECKKISGELTLEHASQLYRYFAVTSARVAILTNGRVYNFYTDLDAPNKMDSKPFLVLDLADIDPTLLPELKKLTKDTFDLDSIVTAAEELKYVGAIKREVAAEFKEPTPEFVKLLTQRVYDGRFTQGVQEKFAGLVDKALRQFLNDRVNDRLKTALGSGEAPAIPAVPDTPDPTADPDADAEVATGDDGIETTADELFAFRIIKAIACAELPPDRITYRDAKSYFAVLADDNNRRPIARCYFNAKSTKWLGLLDEDKNVTRHDLDSIEDIYRYADQIREAARRYV
jgi:hypothetical protein